MIAQKKILFTIQWFGIPAKYANSANALCDEIIINELRKDKRFEIHVLSYGLTGFPIEEEIDGVFVHRFRRSKLWNKFILMRNENTSFSNKFIFILNRLCMRIKQLLFFTQFPNYEPFLSHKFQSAALKLHREHKFDMVISEFNGVDSLKAGIAVKKHSNIVKYLPICWDSISGGRLAKWMPSYYCLKLRRKLETKAMVIADKAIIMKSSVDFHKANSALYDYFKKYIILDVPYLNIDASDSNRQIINNITSSRTLKLLYSGTMTDRNPSPLLDVLNKLNFQVEFKFIIPQQYHSDVLSLKKRYPHVDIICIPYMSHEELSKFQKSSDILVNFGVSNPNAVSGKIFDYMRLGKPVISTISHDKEASTHFLKLYSHALIIDERVTVERNLLNFNKFVDYVNKNPVDMTKVASVFRDNTPDAYISIIESMLYNE